MDGRIASDYYSDTNAGSYIVYPSSGRRIDNNQIWSEYDVILDRSPWYLDTIATSYCSNGTLYYRSRTKYSWDNYGNNWKGGWRKRWNSYTDTWQNYNFPSCYSTLIGWID
ncbi:hypothetical protein [Arcobacter sp. 7ABA8]|uniref:hypothetical protein n=1 Tax=Arcobacter sp. 7ABA8 TaxID=3158260 RepID=UPI003C74452F